MYQGEAFGSCKGNLVLRKKNNMDRLTPFSVLHHHNKKRSYYCGLVTCLNIPPSLSCPFRVFHPPNKCGVIHDPSHPVPRLDPFSTSFVCSALNCVKQPSHPCTTGSTRWRQENNFATHNPAIRAQPPPPTTGRGVPATHHCTDRCVFCDFVGLLVLCTTAHG